MDSFVLWSYPICVESLKHFIADCNLVIDLSSLDDHDLGEL